MSILAQRSSFATSRPAGGVSTDPPRQVHGGGADDPGRAAPVAPNDHRASGRTDHGSQEPLGRLPSRGQRRPSHHPYVRQAVRPHRAGPPEDRPPAHRRRRTQGGQLMRGAVYKRGSTWTWHFDIDPDPLAGPSGPRAATKPRKPPNKPWPTRSANGEPDGSPSAPPTPSATSSRKNGCRRSSRDCAPPPGPTTAPTSPPTSCRPSARS